MMQYFKFILVFIICLPLFSSCKTEGIYVESEEELNSALKAAVPGDVIVMANGSWRDVFIKFNSEGALGDSITLKAETKGSVVIEGISRMVIGGTYLKVEGLVFKNGYTVASELISFKRKKGEYANHCRITECVIDNFNGMERHGTCTWVALYGKNNRVDHCYLVDKRSKGVTMTVRMVDEACWDNNHRIDHNYFGMRQNFGGNGGETLRLGTSHYSLSNCGATVEANYFERCDGEIEIISNKSCGNKFLNNTFMECRGTLTFRHGNDNVAEGNFFFGNDKEHTGGIRIINKRNKAINNYFSEIIGYRFGGALVIMNGVPNSAINRYHQVDGGVFSNNSFINCDHVQLCAGSDEERSAVPINSLIENNLFVHTTNNNMFTVFDDISGITFKNNYVSSNVNHSNIPLTDIDVSNAKITNGIFDPSALNLKGVGSSLTTPVANADNTGVNWYSKTVRNLSFDVGKKIKVKPGINTLQKAYAEAKSGDVLVLESGKSYTMDENFEIHFPITIAANKEGEKAIIKSSKEDMFTVQNEGSLKLKGIEINGSMSSDVAGNSIISTSRYSMNCNYKVVIENCTVKDLDINHSFDFLKSYSSTLADSIFIKNSDFSNITGSVMRLDNETDDLGFFNAEYVIIENSTFKDIDGAALSLYRGGTDESSFGPTLKISNTDFTNVGLGSRNKIKASIGITGVQKCFINNTTFTNTSNFKIHLNNGEPITKIADTKFVKSGIEYNSKAFEVSNTSVNGKAFVLK